MKTSMKMLAASVALAATGSANAAIVLTDVYNGPGELFMAAWDRAGQQSYSLDLGIRVDEFLANPSQVLSYDLTGDSNFAPFIGNTDVVFTVTGGDYSFWDVNTYGWLSTVVSSYEQTYLAAANQPTIFQVTGKIRTMALNSNAAAGDMVDPDLNLSSYTVPGDIGYFGDPTWSVNLGGTSVVAAGAVDTPISFYFAGIDTTDYWTGVLTEMPNAWTLSSSGQLTYAPVSTVPVPAAVWLFGSGLLGLVSVARRRKA